MATGTVQLLPLAIVAGMFILFILSGLRTRTRLATDYGFGGRYNGRVGIGAAIASNWMSAASFMGLAGMFYLKGYFAMAFVVGWTGGYVLLLVLMASHMDPAGQARHPSAICCRQGVAPIR